MTPCAYVLYMFKILSRKSSKQASKKKFNRLRMVNEWDSVRSMIDMFAPHCVVGDHNCIELIVMSLPGRGPQLHRTDSSSCRCQVEDCIELIVMSLTGSRYGGEWFLQQWR